MRFLTAQAARDPTRGFHCSWESLAVAPVLQWLARILVVGILTGTWIRVGGVLEAWTIKNTCPRGVPGKGTTFVVMKNSIDAFNPVRKRFTVGRVTLWLM